MDGSTNTSDSSVGAFDSADATAAAHEANGGDEVFEDVTFPPSRRASVRKMSTSSLGSIREAPRAPGSPGRVTPNSDKLQRSRSTSQIVTKASSVERFSSSRARIMEKEIKAKSEELDEVREKFIQEKDEKEKLQKQLDTANIGQADAKKRLARANDVTEKLRAENQKKTEHVEKLERNISHMEDRIRNLEIRASEVDKAELTLESTRRTLDTKMSEIRDRDKQLERAYEKHEDAVKELEVTKTKVGELEKKIEDLKLQVRYELMKNENIERGLETIPRLKEEIAERDAKIANFEKELEERSALLSASRKAARDYKERVRTLERNEGEVYTLREDLDLARNEVNTLKRLMSSKDTIVLQKCSALDQAKSIVETLKTETKSDNERAALRRIQQVLDQLKQLFITSLGDDHRHPGAVTWAKDKQISHNRMVGSRPRSAMAADRGIDINNRPYSTGNNKENVDFHDTNTNNKTSNGNTQSNGHSSTYIFLERFLQDTEGTDSSKKGGKQKDVQTHHSQQQQYSKWAHTPSTAGKGGTGGTARVSSASAVQRSASLNHVDQQTTAASANTNHQQNRYHSNSNIFVSAPPPRPQSRKGRPPSQNSTSVPASRGMLSSSASMTSPRQSSRSPSASTNYHQSSFRGSTGNLYTSEQCHKLGHHYKPSLDYALGVSTDEELTTDTSHCLSARQNSEKSHNYNNNKVQGRPKSSSSGSPATTADKRNNSHPINSNTGSDSETSVSQNEAEDPFGPRLSSRQTRQLSELSAQQKDAILCDVIQIGDRASITVHQKPPRYGRKKPKPITYTGIVRYKGNLDKVHFDARIYVGLRLDAPLGETDGTYKGKRYMFTPPNHARFFKIRDLDSVLDVQSGMYMTTPKLILRHQDIHLRFQYEQQHQQNMNGDAGNNSFDYNDDVTIDTMASAQVSPGDDHTTHHSDNSNAFNGNTLVLAES